MNRRLLIKSLAAIGSGAALARTAPALAFVETLSQTHLNVSLITDEPDMAISELESLVGRFNFTGKTLEFKENGLSGRHMSDLLVIEDGKIIDYKYSRSMTSAMLRGAAKRLRLPRSVDNPTVLTISSKRPRAKAQQINVYRGNLLVEQLAIARDVQSHSLTGLRGEIILKVRDGQASIVEATCKHRTCVKMGPISAAGQSLVCIPNQLRIAITGEHARGIDTLVF